MLGVEEAADGRAFESYIEHALAPELGRGGIIVMDNLSVHKCKRVEQLIEAVGAQHSYSSRPPRWT